MSISASIDFNFYSSSIEITPLLLINILMSNGWSLLYCGGKSYLPIGDIDDFDWQHSKSITDEEIIKICAIKFKNKEIIGLGLTWLDTNIGGDFLFYPEGGVSFLLNINRIENTSTTLTDFNWYLEKIVPFIIKNNIHIESVRCYHLI